jgi:hypothetical protein
VKEVKTIEVSAKDLKKWGIMMFLAGMYMDGEFPTDLLEKKRAEEAKKKAKK